LLRLLRNQIKDYKIWLKADKLFEKVLQNGDKLGKEDMIDVMHILSFQEVQNVNTWQHLSTLYLEYMIEEKLDLNDIVNSVLCMNHLTVSSIELYEMIVNYYAYKQYELKDLEQFSNHKKILKFFKGMGSMHNDINNEVFLSHVKAYIKKHMNSFSYIELEVCLDIFKFMKNLDDKAIKTQLIQRLEKVKEK
jgi:hypothetical protein